MREIFRDQPKAANVIMLPPEQSTGLFWIDPHLLAGVAAGDLIPKATGLVNARYKTRKTITRVEPIFDAEQDVASMRRILALKLDQHPPRGGISGAVA